MGKRNSMPVRGKIYEYWKDKIDSAKDDNTCFKCGFTSKSFTAVQRCHIKANSNGGDEDVSNLHLLCSNCHKESEIYEDDVYWFWFNDDSKIELKDIHLSDMQFKMRLAAALYFNKINADGYEELTDYLSRLVESEGEGKEYNEKCLRTFLKE